MEKWFVINKGADFAGIAKRFGISPVTARLIRNREAGPLPVELVIGGHHIGHTGFDTGAERRHIDLVQRSFIDQ